MTGISESDLNFLTQQGISRSQLESQIRQLTTGFPPVQLVRPCAPGDGITTLQPDEVDTLASEFDHLTTDLKIAKFVPASGAATRMFKHLHAWLEDPENIGDTDKKLIHAFLAGMQNFAFHRALSELADFNPSDPRKIIELLLFPSGLNYVSKPKALIVFHRHGENLLTAMADHLAEAAEYTKTNGIARIHFTISPEHLDDAQTHFTEIAQSFSTQFNCRFECLFSVQDKATDTISLSDNNEPIRAEDGSLLLRPAGHGAILKNLENTDADIVFIKNIDNVLPPHKNQNTIRYKKALGALLIEIKNRVHSYLKILETDDCAQHLQEMIQFAKTNFHAHPDNNLSLDARRNFLFNQFNRPIRVCGMVKNTGEPGGGPFWVRDREGKVSLQIVETAQMDLSDEQQLNILRDASHFNPCDFVCSITDYQGQPFNLTDFRDPETGFIAHKTHRGKSIKALELPGLWNGSMAHWNTIFVEVPETTFNPVKTVNDLLRDAHLPD